MATDNNTRTNAQTTHENQESKEGQGSQENVPDIDPAVLACQRRARSEMRQAKERVRCRDREATAKRAGEADPAPRPDARDHRGEVV